MNKGLLFLCLAVLALAGWRERETIVRWKDEAGKKLTKFVNARQAKANPDADDPSNGTQPPPTDDAATVPAASTPPPPVEDKPAVAELPPLPPDQYVMRERVSISLDAGIRAYAAGTQVTKTGEEPGVFTVTDGKNTFPVPQSKLTRDPVEVERIRHPKSDAANPAPNASTSPAKSPHPGGPAPETVQRRRELEAMIADVNRQLSKYEKSLRSAHLPSRWRARPNKV